MKIYLQYVFLPHSSFTAILHDSKQEQPLSKALPEARSPRASLGLDELERPEPEVGACTRDFLWSRVWWGWECLLKAAPGGRAVEPEGREGKLGSRARSSVLKQVEGYY